jgi:hypothetical protein
MEYKERVLDMLVYAYQYKYFDTFELLAFAHNHHYSEIRGKYVRGLITLREYYDTLLTSTVSVLQKRQDSADLQKN